MRPELANKFSVTAWGERMPSSKEMSVSTLPEKVIPVMIRSARTYCTASSLRAQTIGELLRQQSEGRFHRFVSITCGPPHDGLAHVSKASIVPNRHPDVKELVRAGIDTLFAVRPVAVANRGLSLR